MAIYTGVLQHGRLVVAQGIGGCRKMLLEARSNRPLRLANVSPLAGDGIGACARDVVHMAHSLGFLEFILRLYQNLPERAARCDRRTQTFGV